MEFPSGDFPKKGLICTMQGHHDDVTYKQEADRFLGNPIVANGLKKDDKDDDSHLVMC